MIDDRVWIIKGHHPTNPQNGGSMVFESDKVLCVVRNPLDVVVSFGTMLNTMSHSAELKFNFAKDYPQWWDWWLRFVV